jgi:hypothetical protein
MPFFKDKSDEAEDAVAAEVPYPAGSDPDEPVQSEWLGDDPTDPALAVRERQAAAAAANADLDPRDAGSNAALARELDAAA